jgi:hypothetical protein
MSIGRLRARALRAACARLLGSLTALRFSLEKVREVLQLILQLQLQVTL